MKCESLSQGDFLERNDIFCLLPRLSRHCLLEAKFHPDLQQSSEESFGGGHSQLIPQLLEHHLLHLDHLVTLVSIVRNVAEVGHVGWVYLLCICSHEGNMQSDPSRAHVLKQGDDEECC